MSETNDWYEGIEREVTSLRDKLSRSDKYLYKLDLLLETAKKVAELSGECKECQGYQNQITNLIAVLKNLPTLNDEGEIPNYSKPFENIRKHLTKHHGLDFSSESWLLPNTQNIGCSGCSIAFGAALFGIAIIWGFIDPMSLGPSIPGLIGAVFFLVGLILLVGFYIQKLLAKRKESPK